MSVRKVGVAAKGTSPHRSARRVAIEALTRIEQDAAFSNLVLPNLLDDSGLAQRDRNFVSELVYGTTRMRRACDFLIDRFVAKDPPAALRTVLRLGAYQLHFMDVAPHAAVGETVALAPHSSRGFVNAVLRKVSTAPVIWPDDATRLSYPDWIVRRLSQELGVDDALVALQYMNMPPKATERADGYTQDRASTWVADLVEAKAGELVLDVCAAPGGKATALASTGATVVAADSQHHRVGLIAQNVARLDVGDRVFPVTTDGCSPCFRDDLFDRILIDAPCSGLGSLRRRADARWRMTEQAIVDLVRLQRSLLAAARPLLKPGGMLVYSVCTLTAAESIDLDDPAAVALPPPGAPWRAYGRGARLLPHDADTDGMSVLRWVR